MKASSANRGLRARDGLWLLGAALAHGLLLLIPPESSPRPTAMPVISVSVTRPGPSHREAEAVPIPPAAMENPRANPRDSGEAPAVAHREARSPQSKQAADSPTVSVARILDSITSLPRMPAAQAPPRRLGVAPPLTIPENWRPQIAIQANRFDGMTVPAKPEILDRWLEADGSHNVVVDAPDGRSYCGRAEAWDPLRPLVEPIMMFRVCGGGGRRDLDLSWFERRRNGRNAAETGPMLR